MGINFKNIVESVLLTEDRVSKIQSKIKKIIIASNPNLDWNQTVENHNGKQMPYIQMVLNAFVSSIFGYEFADANMELAPHTAEIAFNNLDFIRNENSKEVKTLKEIVHLVSNKSQDTPELLQQFNSMSFEELCGTYQEELTAIYNQSREASAQYANQENNTHNGYTIQPIEHFEESEEFYQYTEMLSTPWCLTHMQDMYNSYGSYGRDKIYFIYHDGFEDIEAEPNQQPTWDVPKTGEPPYDAFGYSLICIIVNEEGKLTYCTSRWNHEQSHVNDFLNEEEISELIQDDFYSVFIPYSKEEADEREKSGEFSEDEDSWADSLIFSLNGYEVGYFKDGTLYGMDREERGGGYWDNYLALKMGRQALVIKNANDDTYDIYQFKDGDIDGAFWNVRNIEIIDDYATRDELGIVLGIDGDNDFIVCNMDYWYSSYVSGKIESFEHIENEFYLLTYFDKGCYGIVNWNNENMEIAYGSIEPTTIAINTEVEYVFYSAYEEDPTTGQIVLKRRKIGFSDNESDWEYADNDLDDPNYDGSDDDEYYEDEEIRESKNNFINNFKLITEKLNNIQKRNLPTIYD